jgi:hypothetical protein
MCILARLTFIDLSVFIQEITETQWAYAFFFAPILKSN